MIKKHPSFCILPFISLSTITDGRITVCCANHADLRDSSSDSLEQIWNSTQTKKMRLAFLKGERPKSCQDCWSTEDKGAMSFRHKSNFSYGRFEKRAMEMVNPETGEMPFEIKYLEVRISNLCNLACKMCFPNASTTVNALWDQDVKKVLKKYHVKDIGKKQLDTFSDFSQFLRDVRTIAPYMELIYLAGGEPFMEERFEEVFDALGEHKEHIQISFNSNLTKLKHGHFDIIPLLNQFKSVHLCLSIDGTPKVNEYVRTYSKTTDVEANYQQLTQQLNHLSVSVPSAISALNILDFPELMEYCVSVFHPERISHSFIHNPYLKVDVLPPELVQEASKRIETFLSIKLNDLKISPDIHLCISELCNSALVQLNKATQIPQSWVDFKYFINNLDKKCSTDILDVIPELTPYWTRDD